MRYALCLLFAALAVGPALAQLPQTTLVAARPPQSTLPEADPFSAAQQLCDCDPCGCPSGKCACDNCPCENGQACKPLARSAAGATWGYVVYDARHSGQWNLIRAGKIIGGYDGKAFRWLGNDVWSEPVTCPIALPSMRESPQTYSAPASAWGGYSSGAVCRS